MNAPAARARPTEEDAALLARLGKGDLDALGTLFDRHEPAVRQLLSRLGVSAIDVDDLVQLTFLDLVQVAPKFDGRSSPRSYLLGIAAMRVRRHRRSVMRLLRDIGARLFEQRRPQPLTPAEAYEHAEARARFEHALERLSPKKREVFVLVTMHGATGEEVARALDIPLATVWTRLHHARHELRAELFPEEP